MPYKPIGHRKRKRKDNKCFYYAVSKQLFDIDQNDVQLAEIIRLQICEWMEENFKSVKNSIIEDKHWDDIFYAYPCFESQNAREKYIQYVRGGAMGSGLEALFCAYIYNRPVFIWRDSNPDPEILTCTQETYNENKPIFLFHSNNHWEH